MATTKKEVPVTDEINDRVTVTIPRARAGEDPNFFVGINGKNYIIPKGQAVDVPPEVAAEIDRFNAAVDAMYEAKDARLSK